LKVENRADREVCAVLGDKNELREPNLVPHYDSEYSRIVWIKEAAKLSGSTQRAGFRLRRNIFASTCVVDEFLDEMPV